MHEGLRKKIVSNYTIESITTFPSHFFPGVNFGYAGLSIISIINEPPSQNHSFPVYGNLKTEEELPSLLTEAKNKYEICQLSYPQINKSPSFSFFLPSEKWISNVIFSTKKTIGEYCSVVTGFYSGNDAKHLRRASHINRGAKKYTAIADDEICKENLSEQPPLQGINGKKHWVPIVKGGNRRFYKHSEWYMEWSTNAIHEYKVSNKKKARFQNSQYYFKNGIAAPMVSASSITASLIGGRLFDQSIVGIFPTKKYKYLTNYILGFFNSKVCNDLIRTINASTNNSANYIKKIPLIIPSKEEIQSVDIEVNHLLALAKDKEITGSDLQQINTLFNKIYK